MNTKIAEFWKVAGETRKRTLDVLTNSGIRLTPEEILEETVNIVLDTALIESSEAKGDTEYEDFLRDIRSECIDSFYSKIRGTERNG